MSAASLSSCGGSIHSEPLGDHYQSDLFKWTNYFYGWQKRFFVLHNGTLTYHKSKEEVVYGSRGTISLGDCVISNSENDPLRFDIVHKDCVWYIRAISEWEKKAWMGHLQPYIIDSGYDSTSVNSHSFSNMSVIYPNFLSEKKAEMSTVFSRISWQMEYLMKIVEDSNLKDEIENELKQFKVNVGELEGIMTICEGIITKYEQREIKQPKLQEEEINDSEFYDAIDHGQKCPFDDDMAEALATSEERWNEAWMKATPLNGEDEDLRLYTVSSGDVSTDCFLLKVKVKNFTAGEIAKSFFSIEERNCWQKSILKAETLETYSEDKTVFYELFRQIYLITQREMVSWSHIAQIDENTWTVINRSCDYPTPKRLDGGTTRVSARLDLLGRTKGGFSGREDIVTELMFLSNVNINGWISPHIVNAVAQRTWPKEILRFIEHMNTHYNDIII